MTTVAGVDVSADHFIGGGRVSSADGFLDVSPIDEAPLAEIARGGSRGRPCGRGRRGRVPGLGRPGPYRPRRAAATPADLIDENVDRIAEVECLDMAMLLRSLRARVIARGARNFRAMPISPPPTKSAPGRRTAPRASSSGAPAARSS